MPRSRRNRALEEAANQRTYNEQRIRENSGMGTVSPPPNVDSIWTSNYIDRTFRGIAAHQTLARAEPPSLTLSSSGFQIGETVTSDLPTAYPTAIYSTDPWNTTHKKEKVKNTVLQDTIKEPDFKAINKFRIGFELECQEFNGMKFDEFNRKYGTNRISLGEFTDYTARFRQCIEAHPELFEELKQYIHKAWIKIIGTNDRLRGISLWDACTTKQHLSFYYLMGFGEMPREKVEEVYNRVHPVNPIEPFHPLLSFSRDGSVQGPEIKSKAPMTIVQAIEALTWLCSQNIKVDRGCSFHVHVSLPGVDHYYGKNLQRLMMEYLFNHMSDIPANVKNRWKWGPQNYFKPNVEGGRYDFVAFREEHGTWEFRCFGNIKTYRECIKCILLSIRAMLWAYRQRGNKVPSNMSPAMTQSCIYADKDFTTMYAMQRHQIKEAITPEEERLNTELSTEEGDDVA